MPACGPTEDFERYPGAASAALPGTYRRREPEKTVLYQVVQQHLETFLEQARDRSDSGLGLPWFVEREFRNYARCGVLAHGFTRIRCQACGDELLLAFSCKGRTVCPSCTTRRMKHAS